MSFHKGNFATRLGTMGDIAEGVFEAVVGQGFVAYGFRRPPVHMGQWPAFVRYTPDYACNDSLIEVMGFGDKQVVRLKLEKIAALEEWDRWLPVWLFLWDSHKNRYGFWELSEIVAVAANSPRGTFPENDREHAIIDVKQLSDVWVAYAPPATDLAIAS